MRAAMLLLVHSIGQAYQRVRTGSQPHAAGSGRLSFFCHAIGTET